MNAHKAARMKRNNINNLFHSGFGFMVSVLYAGGAIFCGYGILRGVMTYGSFTAILQLVMRVQSPIANISSFFPQYASMLASAERLMEIEEYAYDTASAPVPAGFPQCTRGSPESPAPAPGRVPSSASCTPSPHSSATAPPRSALPVLFHSPPASKSGQRTPDMPETSCVSPPLF